MLRSLSRGLDMLLAAIGVTLLVLLAIIVIAAVAFRYSGSSLIWYDEVASVLLAWISFFGAAYASKKRAHLGAASLVLLLPKELRFLAFLLAEAVVLAVFAVVAYYGWKVLDIMAGDTLVALKWVTLAFTQSCIPVGAALIMLAQIASAPEAWKRLAEGVSQDEAEIEAEIARARESWEKDGEGRP